MVFVLAFMRNKQDIYALDKAIKELIARMSDDDWRIEYLSSQSELMSYLEKKPLVNMVIYDVYSQMSLEYLFLLRKVYSQAKLMILTDTSISPMDYIRPDLRVSSLLLKPWTTSQMQDVLCAFFEEYIAFTETERNTGLSAYVLETREGKITIPYEQIYYFEARVKKIYVCAGKEEYGFYSSIDRLADELPDYFVRCHRGFIVNARKIRKIMLSQNLICLNDGFEVPLSRSYKAVLKGMGRV